MAAATPRSAEGAGNADEDAGDDALFAEINITPLTDVFLVLVMIFMISALAYKAEQDLQKKEVEAKVEELQEEKKSGLKVTLPSGASQEIDLSKESLVLIVPVDGPINANGAEVPDERLDDLLRRAFLADKATQVVIQADKGVQHGRVVNVMERAKAAGLTRLAIGTTAGP